MQRTFPRPGPSSPIGVFQSLAFGNASPRAAKLKEHLARFSGSKQGNHVFVYYVTARNHNIVGQRHCMFSSLLFNCLFFYFYKRNIYQIISIVSVSGQKQIRCKKALCLNHGNRTIYRANETKRHGRFYKRKQKRIYLLSFIPMVVLLICVCWTLRVTPP